MLTWTLVTTRTRTQVTRTRTRTQVTRTRTRTSNLALKTTKDKNQGQGQDHFKNVYFTGTFKCNDVNYGTRMGSRLTSKLFKPGQLL